MVSDIAPVTLIAIDGIAGWCPVAASVGPIRIPPRGAVPAAAVA